MTVRYATAEVKYIKMAMTNCGVMRESGLSKLLIPVPIVQFKKPEKLLAPSNVAINRKGTTKIKYKYHHVFPVRLKELNGITDRLPEIPGPA